MKILICYDGSADSKSAIDHAAKLFPGAQAIVLTVWEGFSEVLVRSGAGISAAPLDFEGIDEASRGGASTRADEGVELAVAAGLQAQPALAERVATVWETIIDHAGDDNVDAIVMGTRGLKGVKSFLMGSVSSGVLAHSDRPVVIVPGEDVARQRAEERHGRHAGSSSEGS